MQFARLSEAVTFFLHITTVSSNQFILHVPLLFLVEYLCICQLPSTRCYICTIRSWFPSSTVLPVLPTRRKEQVSFIYCLFVPSCTVSMISRRARSISALRVNYSNDIFNYGEYRIGPREYASFFPFILIQREVHYPLPFGFYPDQSDMHSALSPYMSNALQFQ